MSFMLRQRCKAFGQIWLICHCYFRRKIPSEQSDTARRVPSEEQQKRQEPKPKLKSSGLGPWLHTADGLPD